MICFDGIHVFHHQVPHGHAGVERSSFEELHHQAVRGVDSAVGKLPHLKHTVVTYNGILVGYGQSLVGVEVGVQADETEFAVEGVFGGAELAGIFNFIEILTCNEITGTANGQRVAGEVGTHAINISNAGGVEATDQVI